LANLRPQLYTSVSEGLYAGCHWPPDNPLQLCDSNIIKLHCFHVSIITSKLQVDNAWWTLCSNTSFFLYTCTCLQLYMNFLSFFFLSIYTLLIHEAWNDLARFLLAWLKAKVIGPKTISIQNVLQYEPNVNVLMSVMKTHRWPSALHVIASIKMHEEYI